MTERWHLTKIFYTLDPTVAKDPTGDHMAVNLLRPVFDELSNLEGIRFMRFMRFSKQGYHLRLRLYGDESVLADKAIPILNEHIEQYRQAHGDRLSGEMQLSPFAEVINRKWEPDSQNRDGMQTPGSVEQGFLYDTGDELLYETNSIFETTQRLHQHSGEAILQILAANADKSLRMAVLRAFLSDVLELFDLNATEKYLVLHYLRQEWIHYFEIDDAEVQRYTDRYNEREARYRSYFAGKTDYTDSLSILPGAVHDFYRTWLKETADLLRDGGIIARENGLLTPQSAVRVYSFFHLSHNRMGIGIIKELFWAHVLMKHYEHQLDTETINEMQDWVRKARDLQETGYTAEEIEQYEQQ